MDDIPRVVVRCVLLGAVYPTNPKDLGAQACRELEYHDHVYTEPWCSPHVSLDRDQVSQTHFQTMSFTYVFVNCRPGTDWTSKLACLVPHMYV